MKCAPLACAAIIVSVAAFSLPAAATTSATPVRGPILVDPPCCQPVPPEHYYPIGPTRAPDPTPAPTPPPKPTPMPINPGGPIDPISIPFGNTKI